MCFNNLSLTCSDFETTPEAPQYIVVRIASTTRYGTIAFAVLSRSLVLPAERALELSGVVRRIAVGPAALIILCSDRQQLILDGHEAAHNAALPEAVEVEDRAPCGKVWPS